MLSSFLPAENLAMGTDCAGAVDMWYAERSSYTGGYSSGAGHFTQASWLWEVFCWLVGCLRRACVR